MSRKRASHRRTLTEKYPPSEACTCKICLSYCARPGWWTVEQAAHALDAGYGPRMMLEIAPELTFGVLSPAFKGCEKYFATNEHAKNGCTFLNEDRCELFETGHQPLECRFCYHGHRGMGTQCHADLEKDWKTPTGQALVRKWMQQVSFGLATLRSLNRK